MRYHDVEQILEYCFKPIYIDGRFEYFDEHRRLAELLFELQKLLPDEK